VNAAALERLGGSPRGHLRDLPWAGPALQLLCDEAIREGTEAHGDVDLGPVGGRAAATAAPILAEEGPIGAVIRLGPEEQAIDLEALAAGLAHEIKNPLAGLKGAAELMEDELDPASPLRLYTGMIVRESLRVNGLVQALLDLTRPPTLEHRPENLHSICEEVLALASVALPEGLRFERRYDPSLPEVEVDRAALAQVLLNLIQNAVQAMEGREGPIELETAVASGQRLRVRDLPPAPGDEGQAVDPARERESSASPRGKGVPLLRLAVRDRGPGLPPGVDLFTPFVTTRRGGTGLGLVVARRIVEAHGGRLQLRDRAGGGAEAQVLLPLRGKS